MQRRSVIKTVGSVAISGSVLGCVPSASARKIGVGEFEKYTKELVNDHGGLNKTKIASQSSNDNLTLHNTQTQDDKVKSYGNIEETQDISVLYDSDSEFAIVEECVFNDGEQIRQEVKSENGEIVEVDIGDEGFKFSSNELETILNRRLENAKQAMKQERKRQDGIQATKGIDDTYSGNKRSNNELTTHSHNSSITLDGFEGSNTSTPSIPITGKAYADTNDNNDSCQVAVTAIGAGYGGAIAEASEVFPMSSDNLSVEFEGEYAVNWVNATATSDIELKFFVEGVDNDFYRETIAFVKSTFLADLGASRENFSRGIFSTDFPDGYFNFGMKAEAVAAAIGYTSGTTISAATQPGQVFNGDFAMDQYTIQNPF